MTYLLVAALSCGGAGALGAYIASPDAPAVALLAAAMASSCLGTLAAALARICHMTEG